jgi:hypothetical protein
VPIVSTGIASPFVSPRTEAPDMNGGVHYNILQNIWNTNYVLWWVECMLTFIFTRMLSQRSWCLYTCEAVVLSDLVLASGLFPLPSAGTHTRMRTRTPAAASNCSSVHRTSATTTTERRQVVHMCDVWCVRLGASKYYGMGQGHVSIEIQHTASAGGWGGWGITEAKEIRPCLCFSQ